MRKLTEQNLSDSTMKVEILMTWGNDDTIVDVARVSYGKNHSNYDKEKNTKLIKYLIEHGHTSPLRHVGVQFRIKCPIYVERQLFKHQVGISVNSISGRYVDFSDEYYKIEKNEWRKQSKSSKQGSEGLCDDQLFCDTIQSTVINTCKQAYKDLLLLGVSKEQARTVLPMSLMTEFIWTGSLQAFLHLYDLRSKPDTQAETRVIANQMMQALLEYENSPFDNTIRIYLENK